MKIWGITGISTAIGTVERNEQYICKERLDTETRSRTAEDISDVRQQDGRDSYGTCNRDRPSA
jgi:hypothetical protein